ncbi:methionine--tRNA ligase [Nonomuraea rhodomycinica]|uniref:methionine--tRNA ligase n=1 Tax=Nonomuraea rhodomycinica TaxID=1712872 RepID=A0A7Y6IQE1_9ACTN|nr:methionine--tRNA ligase [Nonomuraea rhodomycinica]NUW42491.1 methionine--tRNA ligase [Nonomuraea rhodomycinica]
MYVTTTIPYVNARPHLGFALEIVQADVLARHHRRRGEPVRFQTGTDDNSLKNVLAAEAEGVPVRELVDRNAAAFEALREPLELSFDSFVRTSRHPGHRAGVERIWKAVSHDLYRRSYEGLYCVGCEQFYPEGPCPDGHEAPLQRVAEENWFFRLSRYRDPLLDLIGSGRLRVEPAARRNEVLAFLRGGLDDLSVSRSAARARGWGIPVPGDPDQVVYVWWDALANYVTALEDDDHERWWVREPRKIHLVGKGVIRFHAVHWPAMLLSAGLPLPSDIVVHDYVTAGGRKISKSSGVTVDPVALVRAYGADAVRWWLLREVPRVGDADFTEERLVARADEDLANGIGNLVNRVVTMVHRFQDGHLTRPAGDAEAGGAGRDLVDVTRRAGRLVDAALEDYDFRRAVAAVQAIVEAANAYVERARPWGRPPAEREASLAVLVAACRELAVQLEPFLPSAAARVAAAVGGERLPAPRPLFPRLGR